MVASIHASIDVHVTVLPATTVVAYGDVPVIVAIKTLLRKMVYDVIGAPPLVSGALHVSATCLLPPEATTLTGAPGVVAGVAGANVPKAPKPAADSAAMRNVYAVPFVRPFTTVVVPVASNVKVVHVVPSAV